MSQPPPDVRAEIGERLASQDSSVHEYPWPGLEDAMAEAGLDQLHLAGYGSLLNPDSARRTIPDTPPDGHMPIIAHGARRLFDYVMPGFVLERYGVDPESRYCAALNSVWTNRAEDRLNARLLTVPIADLDALRGREVAYDLVPIVWLPWDDPDAEPATGFSLRATDREVFDIVWVSPDVMPCMPYLDLCRAGARRVSAEFEGVFLDTTTLADGSPLRPVIDAAPGQALR